MEKEMRKDNRIAAIAALLLTVAAFAVIRVRFGFVLEANDDATLRSILSGQMTGRPEAHTIYMGYALSLILSSLYRWKGDVDWFSAFLILLQFASVYELLRTGIRTGLRAGKGKLLHAALGALPGVLILVSAFPHFTVLQYTFAAGMAASAAAVLMYASESGGDRTAGAFLWALAYSLRKNMGLMLLPFVLLGAALQWVGTFRASGWHLFREESTDGQIRRSLTPAFLCCLEKWGFLFLLLAFLSTAHRIGYGSEDWEKAMEACDLRTQLYDYSAIVPYEQAEEDYRAIGLDAAEVGLFESYDSALLGGAQDADPYAVYTDRIRKMQAVSDGRTQTQAPFSDRLKEALRLYLYELRNIQIPEDYQYPGSFAPYNVLALCLYVVLIFLFVTRPSFFIPAQIVTLFCGRTLIWLYLYLGNRMPVRVTLPLWICEISLLGAFVLAALSERIRMQEKAEDGRRYLKNALPVVVSALLLVFVCGFAVPQGRVLDAELEHRMVTRRAYSGLMEEIRKSPEELFYLDVYSMVPYTELSFGEELPQNTLLIGGWTVPSPLPEEKMESFGLETGVYGALLEGGLLVARERDLPAIEAYYAFCGDEISFAQQADSRLDVKIYRCSRR